MDFYEKFVEKYDSLVSFENRVKREANFFESLFTKHSVKNILDCACGTGHHLLMFKQMGYEVKGSDLSVAMIDKARKKIKENETNILVKKSDFRNLSNNFNEKFDAVVCLGNSLPHLFLDEDLIAALSEMHKMLTNKGILILEQRNFDKLVKLKKRFFPVSFRDDEVFFYVLDYYPKKIVFNVIDLETKDKSFNVYQTDYNPLKKDKLVGLLQKSGFVTLELYEDHDFNKFNQDSSDSLLVVCKK